MAREGQIDGQPGRSPRAQKTIARLVESAEHLVAAQGVEGASMRQIAIDAGQANKNVVQHYFGSKDELIVAVIKHRVQQMEAARALLAEAAGNSRDVRALLELLYLPMAELMERDERCQYARF